MTTEQTTGHHGPADPSFPTVRGAPGPDDIGHEGARDRSAGDPVASETPERAEPAVGGRGGGRLRVLGRRLGSQVSRIVLLAAIVAIFGMGLGYALGFPLRYIEYEASSAIALDQASLAGNIEVSAALVAQEDLGPSWTPGDPVLAGFGILGADVCGEAIPTPTPLSSKEAAVWADETNNARIISQALRVDKWSAAEQYIDEVTDALEGCDTFFRTDGGERIKVTSRDIERDPPITDHVDRRYQSPTGVQDWSMMAVGDVIIAIQYLAPTPSPEGFLFDVERSVLERVAPREFAPGGVDTSGADRGDDTTAPGAPTTGQPGAGEPEPTETTVGDSASPGGDGPPDTSQSDSGAADESGGD